MRTFILRRIALMIPVLVGVSVLVFSMVRLVPGDPAVVIAGTDASSSDINNIRKQLGLDRPLFVQYSEYVGSYLRLDFGRSIRSGRPVATEISERSLPTIELALLSTFLATLFGVSAGTVAALRPHTLLDAAFTGAVVVGASAPTFWVGLLLVLIFAVDLRLLPLGGTGTIRHIILPAITLALSYVAVLGRITRASMLEALSDDYIRTARAKGLRERRITIRHALRNALIPTVTLAGLQFGALLSGAIVVEVVFSWPGLGALLVSAIGYRDYPVIQAVVLVTATGFLLINLLIDLLYGYLDPRVRYD